MAMKTAIVIPAYNEAQTIGRVVGSVKPFGLPIVVDDQSTDESGRLAAEAGADVVRHERNKGYDGALQSGFERAAELGMDAVVTFDADGQHDPAVLAEVVQALESGRADLVIGVRPRAARFSEALFGLYARLRFGVPDILCGLKGYRMRLYIEHGRFDGTGSVGTELALAALRKGARFVTVRAPIRPGRGGSRFGAALSANCRILRALALGVWADIRGVRGR